MKRLKRLQIQRIDCVDRGACLDPETGEGAHILLVKRDSSQDEFFNKEIEVQKMTTFEQIFKRANEGKIETAAEAWRLFEDLIVQKFQEERAFRKGYTKEQATAELLMTHDGQQFQMFLRELPEGEPEEVQKYEAPKSEAWTEIEKRAAVLVKDKKLSHAQAVSRVLETSPELYIMHLAEQG